MICRLLIRSLHRVFSFFFFLCCSATTVTFSWRNPFSPNICFKVKEAETVNVPPPPTEKVFYQHNRMWNILYMRFLTYNLCWMLLKLVVFGGHRFVGLGLRILLEALDRGIYAGSPSRFFFFGICATFCLSCFMYWKHFIVTCFSYLLFNTFLLVMYLCCHSLCFSPRSGRSSPHDSWARNFAWYQGLPFFSFWHFLVD